MNGGIEFFEVSLSNNQMIWVVVNMKHQNSVFRFFTNETRHGVFLKSELDTINI